MFFQMCTILHGTRKNVTTQTYMGRDGSKQGTLMRKKAKRLLQRRPEQSVKVQAGNCEVMQCEEAAYAERYTGTWRSIVCPGLFEEFLYFIFLNCARSFGYEAKDELL